MTPHIEAKKAEVASIVIMPGDPLRAKFIAETYLENYKLINDVREMFGYTGYYKGKRVTVMASGMGMPSMGIYSYELFKFYDVETIIRVGSCGAFTEDLQLYDLILCESSYSESNFGYIQDGSKEHILFPSKDLNDIIVKTALDSNVKLQVGRVYCTDVFYYENNPFRKLYQDHNCLATEMESFALLHNAKTLNKNAACILTVSDNLATKEQTTSEERQVAFTKMIELALESIL